MLILSKKSNKDYYDGVVGSTGIDKTIVYNREIIEVEDKDMPKNFKRRNWSFKFRENPFHELSYHRLKKEYSDVCDEHAYFIIGFCGKLYIGWKLYRIINIYDEIETKINYDNNYMKHILEPRSFHGNIDDSIRYIQEYDALHLFRELNTPVFVYDSDYDRHKVDKYVHNNHNPKFIINPLLKDYEFYKVFDTFQTFQEISMFMGGVLGSGEIEIIEVADKYKITQHGFDKWSFRKEPKNGKSK
jgi:hypothetical protein